MPDNPGSSSEQAKNFALPSQISSTKKRSESRSSSVDSASPGKRFSKNRSRPNSRDRYHKRSEQRINQRRRSRSPRDSQRYSERRVDRSRSRSRSPPGNSHSSGRARDNGSRGLPRNDNTISAPRQSGSGGLDSDIRDNEVEDNKSEDNPNKEKPNFGLSGLLVAETNTYNGVVVKYNEPPDALKPNSRWRWYCFKGKEQIDMLQLHRQSAYLIGRDRKVADIPVEHPSISKQHAVLQYRKVTDKDPKEKKPVAKIKPYIIDLDTTNGTYVNGTRIPASRYFELKSQDVLKFAFSTREYVFIKED